METGARIVQLAMCTADLAKTVRRYVQAFGFHDAGGIMIGGERIARLQGLDADVIGSNWWVVSGQELFELELFHHSEPPQRPLPVDWLPNTLGWVRWSVAVRDFDAALARLTKDSPFAPSDVVKVDGLRRVCCRDPEIGTVTEVMEEGDALPRSNSAVAPRCVSITLSVADLGAARAFYSDVMGLPPVSVELHPPEVEAMWGLPGAQRDSVVLDGVGTFLELVQYTDPVGSRLVDRRLSDQGIMNIALGWREREALEATLERAVAAGCTVSDRLAAHALAVTYLTDPLGNSLELLCVPPGYEAAYGFVAKPPLPH